MSTFNLKSFFTFLGRNKLFTSINIIGFSFSLMFVILLGLYITNELGVDKFHQDKERIFRLQTENGPHFPAPIAADIKNRYPEIESTLRLTDDQFSLEQDGEKFRAAVLCADSTFFSFFSFPLLEGDRSRQLRTKQEVTLSESFAKRMFGEGPYVGKVLKVDTLQYIVAGVVYDLKNTHLKNPDIIARFECIGAWYLDRYNSCNYPIYLKVQPNTDFSTKLPDMVSYFKTYFWLFKDKVVKELSLMPLDECYYSPESMSFMTTKSRKFITILGITMLVVLFFAVINYINLSVAQTGFRAKEAATRRLLGGTRAQLFLSFITESILLCFGAFLIAIALALLAEPVFNEVLGAQLSIQESCTPVNMALALLFVVVLGTVSGLVPASVITQFQPIEVVRGTFKRKTKMVYSKILICFQYCITIVLIGCTLTIIKQTNFMRKSDLGFNRENVISMSNTVELKQQAGLRAKLMQVQGVEMVSFVSGNPIDGGNNQTVRYEDREPISFQTFVVDSLFFPMMGLEVVRQTGIKADTAVWINEAAVKTLGLAPDADMFKMYDNMAIAGVVKDFHFRDLTQEIGPLVIHSVDPWGGDDSSWSLLVKISGANQAETFNRVKTAYLEYNGGEPFDSQFMDERINSWYDEQETTYTIIGYFSLLAIVICTLGIFAMATYFMRQRATEIAIRKVFGSTNREILDRLISSFMKLVLVAFVVAVPLIWYFMDTWLKEYAYRIPLHWSIFVIAGAVAFVIAFVAIFWQSYKATTANPINSIKD